MCVWVAVGDENFSKSQHTSVQTPESCEMFRSAISASFCRRRCFSSGERVRGSMVSARRRSSSMRGGVPVDPAEALPESWDSLLAEWHGDDAGLISSVSEF